MMFLFSVRFLVRISKEIAYTLKTSENCPENQKKIWGGLALGQIGKLAGATREAQVGLTPNRP